jgi:hypothetical protein
MRERERERERERSYGKMVLAELGGRISRALQQMSNATFIDEKVLGGVFEGDFTGSAPGGCAVQDGDEHAELHQEDCHPR